MTDYDKLSEKVREDHLMRRDRCDVVPLKRRGANPKRHPNTALITEAAERKMFHDEQEEE